MQPLDDIISTHQDWVVDRAIEYAARAGYLRVAAPSREAWLAAVAGLSQVLSSEIGDAGPVLRHAAFDRPDEDPAAAFVIQEARRHRQRGASLGMFLGMLKYFRLAFMDLVSWQGWRETERDRVRDAILAVFDRLELGFCTEWVERTEEGERIRELQAANRAQSEDRAGFMTLLESLPSPVFLLDAAKCVEYCNPAAWLLFHGPGPRDSVRGTPVVDLAPEVAVAMAALEQSQGDEATVERRMETRQGVRYMDVRISRMRDVRRVVNGTAVILNDVTLRREVEERLRAAREELEDRVRERTEELEQANERLRAEVRERTAAEEILRESEARYRNLIDLSPDGILVHGGGVIRFANVAGLRMVGAGSFEDVAGRQVLDFVHPDDREMVVERIGRMVATQGREPAVSERFMRLDGTYFDVEVSASGVVFEGRPSVQVVFRDISNRVREEREAEERRLAVEILLETQESLVRAEASAAGTLLLDAMSRACRAYRSEWFAADGDDGRLRLDASLGIPPAIEDRLRAVVYQPGVGVGFMAQVATSREPIYLPDCQSDPRWKAMEDETRSAYFVPVRFGDRLFGVALLMSPDPDGFPRHRQTLGTLAADYLAAALESARLNAQTREAEARYRSIFENAVEGIYQGLPDGSLVAVNPALARILGFEDPRDLLADATAFRSRLHPDGPGREAFLRELAEAGVVRGFEYEARRVDGTQVWLSESARAVRDDNGVLVRWEGVVEDVSRRKELERQLQHAQKMEAVGRLAGGVAHDFNNLLTAILGYSGLLLDRLDPRDPAWRDVQEIRDAGKRAAALTGQLLAFSRKQVLQPTVLDLNEVAAAIEKLLRRLIGEDIELVTSLAPEPVLVRVDPGQLDQVLINLAVNSRDAMPNGGRLSIEVSSLDVVEPAHAAMIGLGVGRYSMVSVIDTGVGMDADTRAHLFEPFFTTKGPGKGTGLGLAVVYGIVKQSGGHLWFYSEPGLGTTMRVCLPRSEGPTEKEGRSEGVSPKARGVETVLVAEDEAAVRGLVRVVLESSGYQVLEARDGREALELASRHVGPLDLLVTDVIMPAMNGRDLARALRMVRPGLRVLFTSGYTDSVVVQPGLLGPGTSFLQKPFAPATLLQVVRDLLDHPVEAED